MSAEDHDELAWLRAENALLRTERDMLLRIATGYAEDAAGHAACRTRPHVRPSGRTSGQDRVDVTAVDAHRRAGGGRGER
jgi:transcription elongation factor GreA